MNNNNQAFIKKLIFDPSFRQWVEFAAPDDTIRWEKFITDNADRIDSINYAIATIKALQFSASELSEQTIENEVQKIVSEIKKNKHLIDDDEAKVIKIRPTYIWLKMVGIIVIGVLIAFSYYLINNAHKTLRNYDYAGINKVFNQEYINHSDTAETIVLSDNSKVLLYSKSKLSCSVFNKGNKREVFLSGRAYFKVSKDPSKPFIVYTNKLTTKVLGTSFIINSFPGNNDNASVEVKTGRVSIFKSADFKEENKKPFELSGLIITPNQKVVYSEKENSFKKTLTNNPEIIKPSENNNQFIFKATPLKKVFEILKLNYGITIVYDEETTSGCSLTASMEKESFYEKLDMICKVMNGSYEIVDGNVIFSSKGCK